MSQEWGIYIALVVIINILAMVVLLVKTGKIPKGEQDQETTGHEWDGITELNTPLPRWWLWLFYISIVFSLIYLALYPGLGLVKGLLGWSQTGQYELAATDYDAHYAPVFEQFLASEHLDLAQNDEAMRTARNLFLNTCAACHGSDGRGATGYPNLTDDDWLYGSDEHAIKASITHGRRGVMPAFGSIFSDEDREALVQYVLNLSGQATADEALIAQGESKFNMMCVACHGPGGMGNQLMGAPMLSDSVWLYGGSAETLHETLLHGRQGVMPAHEAVLSPAKIHLLAAYVKFLSL